MSQRHAFRYMKTHDVDYPCFSKSVDFMEEISREKNDPNLSLSNTEDETKEARNQAVKPRPAYKTEVPDVNRFNPEGLPSDRTNWCVLYRKAHPLSQCQAFLAKLMAEKKSLLKQHGACNV